jgi:hypothetical protein
VGAKGPSLKTRRALTLPQQPRTSNTATTAVAEQLELLPLLLASTLGPVAEGVSLLPAPAETPLSSSTSRIDLNFTMMMARAATCVLYCWGASCTVGVPPGQSLAALGSEGGVGPPAPAAAGRRRGAVRAWRAHTCINTCACINTAPLQ